MLPHLSFFLHFVLTSLIYSPFPLRTDPLRFQAECRKRRLKLDLVFLCCNTFCLIGECVLFRCAKLTCCQCRSRMPGLQMTFSSGWCCRNFSILLRSRSVTLRGPGWSANTFVNLYIVRNMSPTSSSIVSAFCCWNAPAHRQHHSTL